MFRLLQEHGAKGAQTEPDVPEWAKPLTLAERRGHREIAALLRQHGGSRS